MDLSFEGSAVDLQSEAFAEEHKGIEAYLDGRHPAARNCFGRSFTRWAEFTRYAYGEWYRHLEHPVPPARDNTLPAIDMFRRGLPHDLVSTDVLIEFHYCTSGFLGDASSTANADQREHFRSRAVQPRLLLDFVLKNVLILVRVAAVETNWPATQDQVRRNCEDFVIKSRGVIPGVDGGASAGLAHLLEITSSTSHAMERRLKLHDVHDRHEELRSRARSELGTSSLAGPLLHITDLATVTARDLIR